MKKKIYSIILSLILFSPNHIKPMYNHTTPQERKIILQNHFEEIVVLSPSATKEIKNIFIQNNLMIPNNIELPLNKIYMEIFAKFLELNNITQDRQEIFNQLCDHLKGRQIPIDINTLQQIIETHDGLNLYQNFLSLFPEQRLYYTHFVYSDKLKTAMNTCGFVTTVIVFITLGFILYYFNTVAQKQ